MDESSLSVLEIDTLEKALQNNGFVLDGEPENTLKSPGMGVKKYFKAFKHAKTGNYAQLLFAQSEHGFGGSFFATTSKDALAVFAKTEAIDITVKPGVVGFGALRLGMKEYEARSILADIPHETMESAFLEKARSGKIPVLTLDTAEDITYSLTFLRKNGLHLARGKYFYTLYFYNGFLIGLTVDDISQLLNSAHLPDETYEQVLAAMFDVPIRGKD
jgi:hypothetical protein